MTDHKWAQENLDAYLAGGLSADERFDLESHAADCAECAQSFQAGRKLETTLRDLFADAPPPADLEERAIARLRRQPIGYPLWVRYVMGAAAVLVLGLLGTVMQAIANSGELRFPGAKGRDFAQAESFIRIGGRELDRSRVRAHGFSTVDIDPAAVEADTDIQYMVERLADVSVPGSVNPTDMNGILVSGKMFKQTTITDNRESMKEGAGKDVRALGIVPLSLDSSPLITRDVANLPAPGGFGKEGKAGAPVDHSSIYDYRAGGGSGGGGGSGAGGGRDGLYGRSGETREKEVRDMARIDGETKLKLETRKQAFDLDVYKLPLTPSPDKTPDYFKKEVTAETPRGMPRRMPAVSSPPPPPADPQSDVMKPGKKIQEAGFDQIQAEALLKGALQPEPKDLPSRKIIRTGDMDFETESFDKGVEVINKLIAQVKGGMIATTNSDKLPNGKMRGAVVVRMPPEFLDKFIADLRLGLAKTSELKGQRIGSQDVTKQYTDIESELRAARAVEGRLIEIIKTGKGEIKDLVAAERELGTWRTKIEKMEGEIRYYNNQVALSTLTINLTEKEIQAPTSIVVTEIVNMHIEVEEVRKAQDTVIAAVELAKGRVTKSDLKLFEAGQRRAIVQAEIPPAAADTFRSLVEKLGVLTHDESQRTQQAEGGSGPALQLKPKMNDVHFALELYNTANIKPRETFTMRVASADVTANYQKIKDAVTKFKGRIRKGFLNEQDKLNLTAEFDFDVFAQDRAEIDKLIAAAGSVMTRNTVQAAVNEISTSSKVGYQLTLRNVAGIMPRESFSFEITSSDVGLSYRKLFDEVTRLDGRILKRQLNEQDKFNVRAEFDFDIARQDKAALDKMLSDAGVVVLRANDQAPNKDESTELKVGYRLTVRSIYSVPPKDIFTIQLASKDVPAANRKLYDEVARVKGRVHKSHLDEKDKFNVGSIFDFDIDAQDKAAIDKTIADSGIVLSRSNDQASLKDDATELKVGYRLTYRTGAGTGPREKTTLNIQVADVDKKAKELKDLVVASGGRVVNAETKRDKKGQMVAITVFEVPHASMDALVQQFKEAGTLLSYNKELFPQAPDNDLATGQIVVGLSNIGNILPSDEGLWSKVRDGLYMSFWIFSWCVIVILIGLGFIVPWAVVIWAGIKIGSWMWGGSKPGAAKVRLGTPPAPPRVETAPKPAGGEDKPAANA